MTAQQKGMTEATPLAVHRCRFVDFAPSAITALAFQPLKLPSARDKGKGKQTASQVKPLRFGTLAVGRSNGNIELCEWTGSESQLEAPQAWVVKKTLAGPYPSKVESIAFTIRYMDEVAEDEVPSTSKLRLFSAGGSSELVEWDMEKGCIKRTVASQGGTIWSISANPASTMLALGCEDGSVRLLSLENDSLTNIRRLDRVKSRILSLAWGPPVPRQTSRPVQQEGEGSSDEEDEENEWRDSWLVTGCSDSSLRKWDLATGRVLDRMGTNKVRGERTLVWAVGVLGDGTIVSGDSMGIVKFWDPVTCTQMDSFQGHTADVLCMTISSDGSAVYTSGVDQKITQFSYVKTSPTEHPSLLSHAPARWVRTSSRRMHSHDVRALAIWPPYAPLPPSRRRQFPLDVAPVLASGGFDMSVVLTPVALPTSTIVKVVNPLGTSNSATFEESYYRRLAYSSGAYNSSALHLAAQARLVLSLRDTGLTVWRILPKRQTPDAMEVYEAETSEKGGGWERILDMDLKVHTNLVTGAISSDGRWIAVSDWYETKLFHLDQDESGDLKPKRIRDFTFILQPHLPGLPATTGASSLCFSPDSSKLVIATSTSALVLIVDLGSEDASPKVLRKFEHHRLRESVMGDRVVKGRKRVSEETEEPIEDGPPSKRVPATITRMAVSPDGQWLATSDDHLRTHVFNLDAITHHCTLPSAPAPVHALGFPPASPHTLVLAFANNTLSAYDVEARTFPRWAHALGSALPHRFTHLHDPVLGVAFDTASPAAAEKETLLSALFWGANWVARVKLGGPPQQGGAKKRQREKRKFADLGPVEVATEEGHRQLNVKIVTHYRSILLVDFIAPMELVVVERPLVDVLAKLPPAYFKPKYGAT